MNERIQELAQQAERLAEDELAHLERVHNRLYSFTEGREIYNQKFAQLIIQDCVSQIAMIGVSNFENDDISWTVDKSIENIRKHFGVEL